jgi:hypothetical protein
MNIRLLAQAVTLSVVALVAVAGTAMADDDWGRGGHRGWHHGRGHGHGHDWDGPRVVYAPAPRVVYAPPPRVVYAPPPVVYAAPPVFYEPAVPSINFVFPLR